MDTLFRKRDIKFPIEGYEAIDIGDLADEGRPREPTVSIIDGFKVTEFEFTMPYPVRKFHLNEVQRPGYV
jgi:hypothetical protein